MNNYFTMNYGYDMLEYTILTTL